MNTVQAISINDYLYLHHIDLNLQIDTHAYKSSTCDKPKGQINETKILATDRFILSLKCWNTIVV